MADEREDRWVAQRDPRAVVRPVHLDPEGRDGPTRGQARARRWRAVGGGHYVAADVERTVEQRIVEVAVRLPPGGMITGWAALLLRGCGWFDGLAPDGRTELPVPIRIPHATRRAVPGTRVHRATRPSPCSDVHGIPCAEPELAVLDEMWARDDCREKVVAMEMAAAGQLTSVRRVRAQLACDVRRRGRVAVRWALDHAGEDSWSPKEVTMKLTWWLDAGYGPPLQNRRVLTLDGVVLGRPDLIDVRRRTCGEYNGALHRDRDRARIDEERREKFAEVGLEGFVVVAGDSHETQVRRMHAAVERAARHLHEPQRFVVQDPPVDADGRRAPTLDELLDDRDRRAGS